MASHRERIYRRYGKVFYYRDGYGVDVVTARRRCSPSPLQSCVHDLSPLPELQQEGGHLHPHELVKDVGSENLNYIEI